MIRTEAPGLLLDAFSSREPEIHPRIKSEGMLRSKALSSWILRPARAPHPPRAVPRPARLSPRAGHLFCGRPIGTVARTSLDAVIARHLSSILLATAN